MLYQQISLSPDILNRNTKAGTGFFIVMYENQDA